MKNVSIICIKTFFSSLPCQKCQRKQAKFDHFVCKVGRTSNCGSVPVGVHKQLPLHAPCMTRIGGRTIEGPDVKMVSTGLEF